MKISPPAFPTWIVDDSMAHGMSLRDYFATAALIGFITAGGELEQIVQESYLVADAMMKMREL